ncbi:DUF1801 domain-containing protein [Shimia sagamensis]|uniref:YdhG-like domain-containing protein n=1 Tax=Shimia sagamensis TaxID=1566352 RepID=A0ABY1P389_9RHOB|nr:DUF1801 domain-containing protein [Shimia sagamensis]SMP23001.1 protein of unknown function (DU1801) [Shimia sagamensis]
MSTNKTAPSDVSPQDFLQTVKPARRQSDALALLDLFQRVSGYPPVMWGPSIIGFGQYHYRYNSGREGDFLATGFSPRKANLVLYIMPGYQDYSAILARVGKHKLGKSCLYINKLDDIDLTVLEELIQTGLADLNAKWPVHAG